MALSSHIKAYLIESNLINHLSETKANIKIMRYIIHLIFYDRAGVQLGDDCVAKLNFKYLREHKGTLPAWGVVESQLATLNLPDNQMIFPTCIRFPTSEPEVRLTWALVSVTFKCHWTNSGVASVDRCQMCISSMKWSIRSCFFFCNVVTFWWVMLSFDCVCFVCLSFRLVFIICYRC